MKQILALIQVIAAVLLVCAILLQNRGSGLGSIFGGEGSIYRTRRGAERILFIATIILAVIFLGSAAAALLFS